MGWAAGAGLGEDIYDKVREYIPEDKIQEVAKFIYDQVCDMDADDWSGDSQLEIDAKVPVFCWNCDEEFTADQLDDEGMCEKCVLKENDE